MSEYTPTTSEVRSSYPLSDNDKVTHSALAWDRIITVEAFDRWLADHDAKREAELAERDAKLAAIMKWRRNWFNDPIPGAVFRAVHVKHLDAILDGTKPPK